MKQEVTIELIYSDGSSVYFDVTSVEPEDSAIATFMMITSGTLQASMAKQAKCYKKDGFELCSFIK